MILLGPASRKLNYGQPVNRLAPLNRNILNWWLVLPKHKGGARWLDLTRRQTQATFTSGGPLWSGRRRPGGRGGSLLFDGSNSTDYVTVVGFSTPTTDCSLSLWFNVSDVTRNNTLFWTGGAGTTNWAMEVGRTSGKLSTTAIATVCLTSTTALSNNTWYHATFTRKDNGANADYAIYLNGVLDGSASATTDGNAQGNGQTVMGKSFSVVNREVGGYMDDVVVVSRTLSATEAMQRYIASRTGYRRELNWIRRPWDLTIAAAVAGGPFPWHMDDLSGGMHTQGVGI